MHYSDLHLTSTVKIEILPTDQQEQKRDVFETGDRLASIFRPVSTPKFAEILSKYFFEEFYSYHMDNKLSISEALKKAIHDHNVAQLNFLGNPESTPKSGAMVLIVYIDPDNQFTIAQVGNILLKQRQNKRFIVITEDHTFNNSREVARLKAFLKRSRIAIEPTDIISDIATTEVFSDQVPSRFIGHPRWCGWGGEHGETIINTQPFITIFSDH